MKQASRPPIYGLMAEFTSPTEVVAAAKRVHEAGYRKVDAYSPYPIEELSHALGMHHSPLPKIVTSSPLSACAMKFGTARPSLTRMRGPYVLKMRTIFASSP